MNPETWSLAWVYKWFIAFMLAQWVNIPLNSRQALSALIAMMLLDVVTGLWAAWQTKTIDSNVGFRGISRKVATLVFIVFAHGMERVVGVELNIEMMAGIGYSINEMISIIENFSKIGVPIPKQLVDALMHVKRMRMASPEEVSKLKEQPKDDG